MKPLPAKTVLKILHTHGFELSRQNGSHQIYVNKQKRRTVIVASHGRNKPISIGTFLAIIKQSGIDRSEWKN